MDIRQIFNIRPIFFQYPIVMLNSVKKHLTVRSLFSSPHQWLFALVLLPGALAERYYQKKYRFRFVHAKKLFIFDMTLLLSAALLFVATIFWWTYDPTIEELISIEITTATHAADDEDKKIAENERKLEKITRIASGDHITFLIRVTNESDVAIDKAVIHLRMPAGFVIEHTKPAESFATTTYAFQIGQIESKKTVEASLEGLLYGTPDQETHLAATLSYAREGRTFMEQKIARMLLILRESRIAAALQAPEKIASESEVPIGLTVSNAYHHDVQHLTIPISTHSTFILNTATTTHGRIENGVWLIDTLPAGTTASLTGSLETHLPKTALQATYKITPVISTHDIEFPQRPATHVFEVIHPDISAEAYWSSSDGVSSDNYAVSSDTDTVSSGNHNILAMPGEVATLTLLFENTGTIPLGDAILNIPIPSGIVDQGRLVSLNHGTMKNGALIITKKENSALATFAVSEKKSMTLAVPIRKAPDGGTDITLTLAPEISVMVSDTTKAEARTIAETPPLAIGTRLLLFGESIYYTNDGDQLGRGPLPPALGKETKYWVLLSLQNGTSRVRDVSMEIALAKGAAWTDKSSVNYGGSVSYDVTTHTAHWKAVALPAHATAHISLQIGVTPDAASVGTIPSLVSSANATAVDAYIDRSISAAMGGVKADLFGDEMGKEKGTIVADE